MTTSNGVTFRHSKLSMNEIHPPLDIDTVSILSSQSDSIQHLSYVESDDEGRVLVGNNSMDVQNTITQTHQPSALKKDWIMYLTKTANKTDHHNQTSSSSPSDASDSDSSLNSSDNDDENEQTGNEDPWTIATVQREYYTKQFRNLQPDLTNVINGHIAKEFFERSTLPTSELSQIWHLSDVNRDGALSLAEFCTAMHLVVLRLNGYPLPETLPHQLQPFAPLIDLTESTENWANFHQSTESPKQFTHVQPSVDNHRVVAPVAVRLSPPPVTINNKPVAPPPPPPRVVPGRPAAHENSNHHHPALPPRSSNPETPQRFNNQALSSTNTTPYLTNRTIPTVSSTSQQQQQLSSDLNILFEQIHELLHADQLQTLSTLINNHEQLPSALNELKSRNATLKAQVKYWEDRLTDLIDKRISLELRLKLQ